MPTSATCRPLPAPRMPRLLDWIGNTRTEGMRAVTLLMSETICCWLRSRLSHGVSVSTMKPLLAEPPWPEIEKMLSISPDWTSGCSPSSIRRICACAYSSDTPCGALMRIITCERSSLGVSSDFSVMKPTPPMAVKKAATAKTISGALRQARKVTR
ncbi:hypothetical protein D3C72_1518600 [compost metagenome]